MTDTINVALDADVPLAISSGPGNVTITPSSTHIEWAIQSSSSVAPTLNVWHKASAIAGVSMEIQAGEHVWVKSRFNETIAFTGPAAT